MFGDWVRTGRNWFRVGFRRRFWDISFLLHLLSSCLPTPGLPTFYTLHLTRPPPGLFVIGCAANGLLANWLNWLKFGNAAAGLFVLPTPPPASLMTRCISDCCDLVFPPPECHACYHRSCFRAGKDCPRCQRLAERRERMARKNMEEQEDEGGGS